jgi:hypothetical protein
VDRDDDAIAGLLQLGILGPGSLRHVTTLADVIEDGLVVLDDGLVVRHRPPHRRAAPIDAFRGLTPFPGSGNYFP